MRNLAGALLSALIVLAGCSSAPRRPTASPLPVSSRPPEFRPVPAVTNSLPVPATTNLPALQRAVPPPGNAPLPPTAAWRPLNQWAAQRGLGPLRRVTAGPVESFALIANTGVLTLNVGSLSARWDQLDVRLGFAPQLTNGELFVHALDLRKNIEPLLRGYTPLTKADRLIVIDPGHGGANPGTRSAADGRLEKEFTLDWALRLAPLLRANGWRVWLTRTNDSDVALADRVAAAEQQQADLFLSLHFNSAGGNGRDPAGLETYCLTPTGMTSSLTRGYEDDVAAAFPNNRFDEANLMYAVRLHAALLKVNGHADRGLRRARFLSVLQGQNRPAVLLEGGYLSTPAEARRIADPAFRQRLAEAVARALN